MKTQSSLDLNPSAKICAAPSPAGHAQDEITKEYLVLIESALARLPARQRQILAMRSTLNLSYEEIGVMLNIEIGMVKSRIAVARAVVLAFLTEACSEAGPDSSFSANSAFRPAVIVSEEAKK